MDGLLDSTACWIVPLVKFLFQSRNQSFIAQYNSILRRRSQCRSKPSETEWKTEIPLPAFPKVRYESSKLCKSETTTNFMSRDVCDWVHAEARYKTGNTWSGIKRDYYWESSGLKTADLPTNFFTIRVMVLISIEDPPRNSNPTSREAAPYLYFRSRIMTSGT